LISLPFLKGFSSLYYLLATSIPNRKPMRVSALAYRIALFK